MAASQWGGGFSPNHWPLCAASLFRNQHFVLFFVSCAARYKKTAPRPAAAASERRAFFASFSGTKRKDHPADCRSTKKQSTKRKNQAADRRRPVLPATTSAYPFPARIFRQKPALMRVRETKTLVFMRQPPLFHTSPPAKTRKNKYITYLRNIINRPFLICENFVIIYKEICENCVKTANEYPLQNLDFWLILKTTSRDPKHGT